MAHAEHFLGRLERLEEQQVELALRLYYDHRLVAHVLRKAELPDGTDRVALSLGHEHEGPFLIVTRDGKFVTCLGHGMQHDLPVITRHRLDVLAERLDGLRSLVTESKADGYAYTRRLLRKFVESGLVLIQPRLDEHRIPVRPAASDAKPGRNEPCACGSGRKYKRCCGDPAASDRDPG